MIEINGMFIQADIEQILNDLRSTLHSQGIYLLKDIKPGNNNIQFTCIEHGNGQERKPSSGINLVPIYRSSKLIPTGTVHCFTCGYTADLPTFISNCFGKVDGGRYGSSWLRRNYGSTDIVDRGDLVLDMSREKKQSTPIEYITEEVLDSYRWTHPYIYTRCITDDLIEMFDIGYDAETKCITLPVHDANGRVPFIQTRSVVSKFHHYEANVRKTDYVYGVYEVSKYYPNAMEVAVCESIFNALTFWLIGKPAVALMGTGGGKQYDILKKLPYRKYNLALDPDDAGRKGTQRLIKHLKNTKLLAEYVYPDHRDLNELAQENIELVKHLRTFLV